MKTVRKIAFWSHFVFALTIGLVIGTMGGTGSMLAFRERIVTAAEGAAPHVTIPKDTDAMALSETLQAVREAHPDSQAQMMTLSRDPQKAIQVSFGKGDLGYFNPYTGDLVPAGHQKLRDFFDSVEHVHRWLGMTGDARDAGKTITGIACATYLFLLLSGLYLWWPRSWTFFSFRKAATPRLGPGGRARDWNWHTVAGFWASPLLFMTTSTGLFMAFPKLVDLVAGAKPVTVVATPAGTARMLGPDDRLASVEEAYPHWDSIMIRMGGRGGPQRGAQGGGQHPQAHGHQAQGESRPRGEGRARGAGLSFIVRESGSFPALPQEVAFDPVTGKALPAAVTPKPSAADAIRASVKLFHIGEAFGWVGESLVCLGGLITLLLVYTGFALAWRRLFGKKAKVLALSGPVADNVPVASR